MSEEDNQHKIKVKTMNVKCSGYHGVFGHPLVYFQIDKDTKEASCPYCSKRFILDLECDE